MKIVQQTTKRIELADGMAVTLTIDGDGQVIEVHADTASAERIVSMRAETFDRIATVVAEHREELDSYKHGYVKAPRVCADHGHFDRALDECPKCAEAKAGDGDKAAA